MIGSLIWFREITKLLYQSQPSRLFTVVTLGGISRILSMLALLLPVKILLLSSNQKLPSYDLFELQTQPISTIVATLCAVTLCLYTLHILLEKIITHTETQAATSLAKQFEATSAIPAPSRILKTTFRKVYDSLTEIVFGIVVLLFTAAMYAPLALLLATYIAFALTLTYWKKSATESLAEQKNGSSSNMIINIWVDSGFLLAFFFITYDLLNNQSDNIMVALACFLLLRRCTGGIKRLLKHLQALYQQQDKISAIIQPREHFAQPEQPASETGPDQTELAQQVLQSTLDDTRFLLHKIFEVDRNDPTDISYLAEVITEKNRQHFLIRLFHQQSKRAKAEHRLYHTLGLLKENQKVYFGQEKTTQWLIIPLGLFNS